MKILLYVIVTAFALSFFLLFSKEPPFVTNKGTVYPPGREYGERLLHLESTYHPMMDRFAQEQSVKWSLKFLNRGTLFFPDNIQHTLYFGLAFTDSSEKTLPEARAMIVAISLAFYDLIDSVPAFRDLVRDFPKKYDSEPYDCRKWLAIKIAFWDENVDRPLEPYIADVRMIQGKIYYYYADPKTQALMQPNVETIEEAQSILSQTKNVDYSSTSITSVMVKISS